MRLQLVRRGAYVERLAEFGARVGAAETQRWAAEANRVVPTFVPYDRFGRRIDEVEFHPSYHRLMQLGLEAGVSGAAWNGAERPATPCTRPCSS